MFAGFWPSMTDLRTDIDHAAAVEHGHFLLEAFMLSRAITDQLKDGSVFRDYLSELPDPASFLQGLSMDFPLHVEVLLPIRLPIALAPIFDEKERTVQLEKPDSDLDHPFFFGKMLNSTCMNILLEQELQQAIATMGSRYSFVHDSVVYDLSYRAHSCRRGPFMHEILAVERNTNGRRCLRLDFILAVLFEGPVLPLPPYYDAPMNCTWLAYGTIAIDRNSNPADWSVILPKWQARPVASAGQCRNVLLLTHRLLCAQQGHSCAIPGSRKPGLATVVQEIDGSGYERTTSLQLILMIMNKLVEENIFRLDYPTNVINVMLEAGQQRMRLEGLIRILENLRDATPGDANNAYFRYIYILPSRQTLPHKTLTK